MSRPQSASQSVKSIRQSSMQPNVYFENPYMASVRSNRSSVRSQRSFDGNSVQSLNVRDGGSGRNSMGSSFGLSRKSDKSILSNYPAMISKQSIKDSAFLHEDSVQTDNKKSSGPKSSNHQQKKQKANYYIDEDYFYSSQFKRQFVKGMLSIAKFKNIQDLSLLLRQLAPTIMIKSQDTSIWVTAYLIIFSIQQKMRRQKLTEQNILQLIEDSLIEYMLKNKQIKKARLIKILVYIFKELPVYRPKVLGWFEEFIRRNRDRLSGVDIGRYVDIFTINPAPIDYTGISKSAVLKAKIADKEKRKQMEKQKEKQVINLEQKQKTKRQQLVKQQLQKSDKQSQKSQNRSQGQTQNKQKRKQKQINPNNINMQVTSQASSRMVKSQKLGDKVSKSGDIAKSQQLKNSQALSANLKSNLNNSVSNKQIKQISTQNQLQTEQLDRPNKIPDQTSINNLQNNPVNPQPQFSLQQMISQRIQSAFVNSTADKNRNIGNKKVEKQRQRKSQNIQINKERHTNRVVKSQKEIKNQRKLEHPVSKFNQLSYRDIIQQDQYSHLQIGQKVQMQKPPIKDKIKKISKDRHQQLKHQNRVPQANHQQALSRNSKPAQARTQYPANPYQSYQYGFSYENSQNMGMSFGQESQSMKSGVSGRVYYQNKYGEYHDPYSQYEAMQYGYGNAGGDAGNDGEGDPGQSSLGSFVNVQAQMDMPDQQNPETQTAKYHTQQELEEEQQDRLYQNYQEYQGHNLEGQEQAQVIEEEDQFVNRELDYQFEDGEGYGGNQQQDQGQDQDFQQEQNQDYGEYGS